MCLPQDFAVMPLESGIMPLSVNDCNTMYLRAHGLGVKQPAVMPPSVDKRPRPKVQPPRIVLSPFANVYRSNDVCHPPVLMRGSSDSPIVPIFRERKVDDNDSVEHSDSHWLDRDRGEALGPGPDIIDELKSVCDESEPDESEFEAHSEPHAQSSSPDTQPTPAQSEKDSSPLWTAPTVSPSPSPIDVALALLRTVNGGDAKFHSVFSTLTLQVLSALKALNTPTDFKFAFREFAGFFNLALKRFGLGSAEVDCAPPPENWTLPFVIPWLHVDTLSDEHAVAFNDACEWICLLTGWTQSILNDCWDLIVEAMTLPREDMAECATNTALSILDRCRCRHDMICRTILLRHATMGFDEPQMASFRMRRLRLLDFVAERAAQEDLADSQSAMVELIHEFEVACCNEPSEQVRDAAAASLERARYLQTKTLILDSPMTPSQRSFRDRLSTYSGGKESRSLSTKSQRLHQKWQRLKFFFGGYQKKMATYEATDNVSALSSDIDFPTARSNTSGSIFRRIGSHMRLVRNDITE